MKFNSSIISVLVTALLICGSSAHAQKSAGKGQGKGEGVGQSTSRSESKAQGKGQSIVTASVTESVNVTLTLGNGKLSVRGWDKSELRAQVKDSEGKIALRKDGGVEASNHAASRVEISVYDKSEDEEEAEDESCTSDSDVVLDVPRGATVYLTTQDGDIDVEDVVEAHVETAGGRIDLRRVAKATEATSAVGDVSLEDSKGRARLTSIGGVIAIRDLSPLDANDFLRVRSGSGDILLDGVSTTRIEATSIGGVVKMVGPLARGGIYSFTTTTGDITLVLPADSSFKLNAKVSEGGVLSTEFPLKYKGDVPPLTLLKAGRLKIGRAHV